MRVVMTFMVVVVTGMAMFVHLFRCADGWFLFSSFGSHFGGLLGLLFGDCQWITFRYFRWRNRKPLV